MRKQPMLDHKRLLEVLSYDRETGDFTCRITRRSKAVAGSIAGTLNSNGYIQISIDRTIYLAHRLAWFYVHEEWPPRQIDHRNELKSDNRFDNLRLATGSQNMLNTSTRRDNTSGIKGVSFTKRTGKWAAYLHHDGKRLHLGSYLEKSDAEKAVRCARESLHESFCNHGNGKGRSHEQPQQQAKG